MKEITGDLFHVDADCICITTNGFVKSNGEAVMGRGCAKQAANYIPSLPKILGKLIQTEGNIPNILITKHGVTLCSFPVKPKTAIFTGNNAVKHMKNRFNEGDVIPGWACIADVNLIVESAKQIVNLANENNWKNIVIPRPGCGAGELSWKNIKLVLEPLLDDRFSIITFK